MDATPSRVFHRSSWNYAYFFYMVCRCACDFVVILPLFYFQFFFLLFRPIFSGLISTRIDTLCAQLLLEFSTDHFETMHTSSTWSVDLHVVLGLSSHYFVFNFFLLFSTQFFFSDLISIRIDTLWTQLVLEFSTDHSETMQTSSTWSVDVHVVLGLFPPPPIILFLIFFSTFSTQFFQVWLVLE